MQTQPQPVEATMKMGVTLEAQQWNQIMAVLSEAPYKIAAPLIQTVGEQLQQQAQAQAPQGMQQMAPRPNGPVPNYPTEVA